LSCSVAELPELSEVNDVLAARTILHLGGPHRGGTTILTDILARHNDIGPFAVKETSRKSRKRGGERGPRSEGIFWQSVYPKFGIAPWISHGVTRLCKKVLKWVRLGYLMDYGPSGIGGYAFNKEAHLTEANETGLLTVENKRRLFGEWSRHWPVQSSARILLEKSPPNIMIWRYLQALWNLGSDKPVDVRFIFISRHPWAVALAQMSWNDAKHLNAATLVNHWVVQQEASDRSPQREALMAEVAVMREELASLKEADEATLEALLQKIADLEAKGKEFTDKVLRVQYEELMDDPNATVHKIFDWLGLDNKAFSGMDDMDFEHGNVKYMQDFCGYLANPKAVEEVGYIVKLFETRVQKFGYSLQSWKDLCDRRYSISDSDGEDLSQDGEASSRGSAAEVDPKSHPEM
jgi:hypothetical protein